jgi:hypothetical protein
MILISGCSFTSDYSDYNTWSTYLTKKMDGIDIVRNVSSGGASNKLIYRRAFWHLNNTFSQKEYDYAIIQWSTIDRWDYPVFVDEEKSKNGFPRMDMHPERINKINYMSNGTDTFGYGSKFYETYYSLYGAVIDTLENIHYTQLYLKSINIPYKMITIGNLFGMDASISKLIELQKGTDLTQGKYSNSKINNLFDKLEKIEDSWYDTDNIKYLLNKIDFSKFIFTDDVSIHGFGGGIIEWFLNKNETLTGGNHHPSSEQHQRFFEEFLWDKIKNEINGVTESTVNKGVFN